MGYSCDPNIEKKNRQQIILAALMEVFGYYYWNLQDKSPTGAASHISTNLNNE